MKLGSRAASVGFDWPDIGGVLDKIDEEIEELRVEMRSGDRDKIRAELGDVLFESGATRASPGVDAEAALRQADSKFERRFRHMEAQLAQQGREAAQAAAWRVGIALVARQARTRLTTVERGPLTSPPNSRPARVAGALPAARRAAIARMIDSSAATGLRPTRGSRGSKPGYGSVAQVEARAVGTGDNMTKRCQFICGARKSARRSSKRRS